MFGNLWSKAALVLHAGVLVFAASVTSASECDVQSNYTGKYTANYSAGSHAGEDYTFGVTFSNSLSGSTISVAYQTSSGVQGTGTGVLNESTCEAKISYSNTTPSCPGTYSGNYTYSATEVTWTYSGEDCWGTLSGEGTAQASN
jgi:hypothetical protein